MGNVKVISGFLGKYHFLSNFHPSFITIVGISYRSVEAAYQASKTDCINTRREFANFEPAQAKRSGKHITLRNGWGDVTKIECMELCLRAKFMIPELRDRLISTDPLELIETNSWGDQFWGVCNGSGRNVMGKLLMMIRDEIISYEPEEEPSNIEDNDTVRAFENYEDIPF